MYNKINALKAKLLPKNLYSRLTLITLVTVMTGYAIIYAYTAINSAEYAPSAPLTSTLMGKIVGNLDELNNKSWGLNGLASYYTAGNVGIGTNGPSAKLHINSGNTQITNNISRILLQDTQTSGATYEITSGWSAAGNFDIIKSGVASRMTIDTNGNVGIETVTPQAKLDVTGGAIKVGSLDDVPNCTSNIIGAIIFDGGPGDGGLCVCSRLSGVYQWFKVQSGTWGTAAECY